MPDPFLQQGNLESDYQKARCSAEFYGAGLWREDSFVFLECQNQQGQTLLARIDCHGYPETLPEVTFLDPSTKKPSQERMFWPGSIGPLKSSGGFGICLAGTRAYAEHHGTNSTRHSLSNLVEIVILCCRGQVQALALRMR